MEWRLGVVVCVYTLHNRAKTTGLILLKFHIQIFLNFGSNIELFYTVILTRFPIADILKLCKHNLNVFNFFF